MPGPRCGCEAARISLPLPALHTDPLDAVRISLCSVSAPSVLLARGSGVSGPAWSRPREPRRLCPPPSVDPECWVRPGHLRGPLTWSLPRRAMLVCFIHLGFCVLAQRSAPWGVGQSYSSPIVSSVSHQGPLSNPTNRNPQQGSFHHVPDCWELTDSLLDQTSARLLWTLFSTQPQL